MRTFVKDLNWKDDYDDLSSFQPGTKLSHEALPAGEPAQAGAWHGPQFKVSDPPALSRDAMHAIVAVFIGVLFLALLVGAMVQASTAGWHGDIMGAWYFGIAVGLIVLVLVALDAWSGGTVAPPHVAELAEHHGLQKGFPVQARISVDDRDTGIDDGIVVFEHDLIVFHGNETSFAIGAQDLLGTTVCRDFTHDALQGDIFKPTLVLRHPQAKMTVTLQAWSRLDAEDSRDCAFRFRRELRIFLNAWRPAHRTRTLPPVNPQKPSEASVGVTAPLATVV